jgi:hypothetical protein
MGLLWRAAENNKNKNNNKKSKKRGRVTPIRRVMLKVQNRWRQISVIGQKWGKIVEGTLRIAK